LLKTRVLTVCPIDVFPMFPQLKKKSDLSDTKMTTINVQETTGVV